MTTLDISSQISKVQEVSERLESEQLAGVGAQPGYLLAEEVKVPEPEPTLSVDISAVRASISSSATALLTQSLENLKEEFSNYIFNRPLRELLMQASPSIEETSGVSTVSFALTSETGETQGDTEDEYYVSGNYKVEIHEHTDENGNTKTEVTVTDPDGEKHTFDSVEEAEAYLAEESRRKGGCIIVDYTKTWNEYDSEGTERVDSNSWSAVYVDGEKGPTFTDTEEEGVVILSAHEKAEQWVQNQHYQNADTSYIYEYESFKEINENSSDYEVCDAVGEEMDRTINNYDERDFYYYDKNGYLVVDNQRLEDWYNKIRLLCALLVALQMLMEAKHEARDLVQQEMLGIVLDKGLDTATIIGKYVQNRLARASMAFAKLLEKAQEWNKVVYERKVAAAKAANDSCGEKTVDFITGGNKTIESLEGQKEAAENYLQATTSMLELLKRTAGSQKEFELGNSDTAKINEALQKGEMLILAELPSIAYQGENGYLELDDEKLESLRKRFYGIQNLKRAWNAINASKTEARNLVHEEMTGVGGREKSQNASRLQEMEGSHATQLFETEVSLTQQKIQLHNNKRYLENQIEKARTSRIYNIISNILSLVAIAVSFIPGVGTILGIVVGVLAAGVRLAGAIHSYYLSENYKPDSPSHKTEERDTETGNPTLDTINETANMEDKVLEKIDERYLDQTGDGFYEVNFKAIADLQKQLEKIQNIRRALLALEKEKASTRKLVHMEMTGVGGRETSDYVASANEADFQQTQFKLEMLAFMLNEVKTAKNIEVANEKQLTQAIISFAISLALQILGGCIGGALSGVGQGAGQAAGEAASEAAGQAGGQVAGQAASISVSEAFAIGWSIGGAIGGFLAAILNNTVFGSFGVSYGDSSLPAYLKALRHNNPNTTEARLSQLEAEIFEELLLNGINKDVGDGYWALDGAYLAKLRAALGRIAHIKDALASLYAAKGNTRNLVHMEMTGVSGRRAGEYSQEVSQAEFYSNLKVFDQLTMYQTQRIEARQRHIDAKKALTDACWKLGIDAVIIAAGASLGANVSSTFFFLTSPVMMLANSAYDLVASIIRSRSGLGKLENYDAARIAKEIKDQNDPDATMNKLDQMEAKVYAEISQNLIEELGAGRWGVNSGTVALLRHKMEKIYNLKEALAKLQAAEAEARAAMHAAMTGVGGSPNSAAKAFAFDRMVALANVGTLFRNIQTMVARHNQMNEASRAWAQALTGTAFAALNIWLACKSAENSLELKQNQKDLESISQDIKQLQEAKALGTSEAPQADAVLDAKYARYETLDIEREKLLSEMKDWQLYQFLASISGTMAVWLTGLIYDTAQEERSAKGSQFQAQVGKVSNTKGWAASVANSEVSSTRFALSAGSAELEAESLEIPASRNEELVQNSWEVTRSTINYVKDLRKPNPQYRYQERNRENAERIEAPAGAPTPANVQPSVSPPPQNDQPPANNYALRQRLEALIAQVDEKIRKQSEAVGLASSESESVAQTADDGSQISLENVDLSQLNGQEQATLEELLEKAKAKLEEALHHHSQAVEAYRQAQSETPAYKEKLTAAMHDLDGAISELEQALQNLSADPVKNAAAIKALQAKINFLKAAKAELQRQIEAAGMRVASARAAVEEARREVQRSAQVVNRLTAAIERRGRQLPAQSFQAMYQQAQQEEELARSQLAGLRGIGVAV